MFTIIEYARMMVGTKAISTLSTGYLNALEYAKSRVQGPDLTKQLDKASPRVTIMHHADVRRSLLTQKAYAEGMRALVLYTASIQDSIMLEKDETKLEHKMGLNVSATAELNLGEKEPCVGYLLGEVHNGIAQMFTIIEYARMMVGTKAISTLSTGYLNALEYAKSRVQGPDLTKQLDKASPRVTIMHHADVRRSLLTQKAYAEGMRDRKSTRLNSSHIPLSRMPSSA